MKGVSPVVATVLMVAVAIAAAVVAYSWFMSMQASVQAEASRGAGTVGKERIRIDSVYCVTVSGTDNDELKIVLRNMGDEDVNGQYTITIKDAATGVVLYSGAKDVNVPAGSVGSTTVELNSIWETGNADCNTIPSDQSVVVVEVMAPGGAVASIQQRVR